MSYLVFFCRVVLAGTFLVAVIGKLRDRRHLTATVAGFGLVPRGAEAAVAAAVLAAEALVVALLALPSTVPVGFLLAAVLLIGFAAAVAAALARGVPVPCNCFGRSSVPLGRGQVVRNLILAGIAVAGAAAWQPAAAAEPGPLLVVGLVGVAAVVLVHAADAVARLYSPPPPTTSEVRHGYLEPAAGAAGRRRARAGVADRRDHQEAERTH